MQDHAQNQINPVSEQPSQKPRDWTQGNILKNLLSLAWPMIISNTVNTLGPLVDTIWVGRLGPDYIAAVGAAGSVVMLVNALMVGIFTGLRAMIARFIGARDNQTAVHVARQAFVLALIYAIVLFLVGIFLSEWILTMLGVAPDIIAIGEPYLRIELVGVGAMSLRMMTDGTMQAAGDTWNPMKIAITFRALHIALCPLLIFGWGLFPGLGVNGAAYTGVVTQTVGTLIGFWILSTGRTRIRFNFRGFRFDFPIMWRLTKIGIPSSLMMLQNQFGQLVLMRLITSFGTIALASYTLCQRLDMVLTLPLMGLGAGAGILVGQNLGAKQPQRAERSGWIALGLCEVILVTVSTLIIIWPEPIIRIFNSDPELMAVSVKYLRIATVAYSVFACSQIIQACVTGAGDTVFPLIISIVSIWAIQVPLAIFLSQIDSLNIYGVRWAITFGTILTGVAYIIYFRAGRWKKKNV